MLWSLQGCNLKYVVPLLQLRKKEAYDIRYHSYQSQPCFKGLSGRDCYKGPEYRFLGSQCLQSFFEQKTVASTTPIENDYQTTSVRFVRREKLSFCFSLTHFLPNRISSTFSSQSCTYCFFPKLKFFVHSLICFTTIY